MQTRIFKFTILLLIVAGAGIFWRASLLLVSAQSKEKPKPKIDDCITDSPIDALNAMLQKCFLETNKGFGISRLTPFDPHHLRHFYAENSDEASVVNALNAKNLRVNLLLAGRILMLAEPPPNATDKKTDRLMQVPHEGVIKGPVIVTGGGEKVDFAEFRSEEFVTQTQAAMKHFEIGNDFKFNYSNWTVEARPVRASNNSCVKCHNNHGSHVEFELARRQGEKAEPLKIGDALGVLLFAYKQKEK